MKQQGISSIPRPHQQQSDLGSEKHRIHALSSETLNARTPTVCPESFPGSLFSKISQSQTGRAGIPPSGVTHFAGLTTGFTSIVCDSSGLTWEISHYSNHHSRQPISIKTSKVKTRQNVRHQDQLRMLDNTHLAVHHMWLPEGGGLRQEHAVLRHLRPPAMQRTQGRGRLGAVATPGSCSRQPVWW